MRAEECERTARQRRGKGEANGSRWHADWRGRGCAAAVRESEGWRQRRLRCIPGVARHVARRVARCVAAGSTSDARARRALLDRFDQIGRVRSALDHHLAKQRWHLPLRVQRTPAMCGMQHGAARATPPANEHELRRTVATSVWDTVQHGIPCRVGSDAACDTVVSAIPLPHLRLPVLLNQVAERAVRVVHRVPRARGSPVPYIYMCVYMYISIYTHIYIYIIYM